MNEQKPEKRAVGESGEKLQATGYSEDLRTYRPSCISNASAPRKHRWLRIGSTPAVAWNQRMTNTRDEHEVAAVVAPRHQGHGLPRLEALFCFGVSLQAVVNP